mmetsp:Transcript_33235/g.82260  ORF Transcript_33235/g.82260 Transcript_33235/m.82260 type:complete len:310 (-) Transcript_33235:48-977(-)
MGRGKWGKGKSVTWGCSGRAGGLCCCSSCCSSGCSSATMGVTDAFLRRLLRLVPPAALPVACPSAPSSPSCCCWWCDASKAMGMGCMPKAAAAAAVSAAPGESSSCLRMGWRPRLPSMAPSWAGELPLGSVTGVDSCWGNKGSSFLKAASASCMLRLRFSSDASLCESSSFPCSPPSATLSMDRRISHMVPSIDHSSRFMRPTQESVGVPSCAPSTPAEALAEDCRSFPASMKRLAWLRRSPPACSWRPANAAAPSPYNAPGPLVSITRSNTARTPTLSDDHKTEGDVRQLLREHPQDAKCRLFRRYRL